MSDITSDDLRRRLKQLIIEECDKPFEPDQIPDDQPLFGSGTLLELDSLDGLQISMALQKQFNVRVEDPKMLRRVMTSVDSLAAFVEEHAAG